MPAGARPAVAGKTVSAATAAIKVAGCSLGTVSQVTSATVANGKVISSTPAAGTTHAAGTKVNLKLSSGTGPQPKSKVVGVAGQPETTATAALVASHCGVSVTEVYSLVHLSYVISQSPTSGTFPAGKKVHLTVSKGPKPGKKPGNKPGHKPGKKPGNNPGTKPGHKPGTKPGHKPGKNGQQASANANGSHITVIGPHEPSGFDHAFHLNGDVYYDPSGLVQSTKGVPLAGAQVVLLASNSSAGPFAALPNGSTAMSPANRKNPDHTNAQGLFGWDTLPGFYEITASHPGCTGSSGSLTRTPVYQVPPPVTGIVMKLSCPHLKRVKTHVAIGLGQTRGGLVVATATVHGRHPTGTIRFAAGRIVATVPLAGRRATFVLPPGRSPPATAATGTTPRAIATATPSASNEPVIIRRWRQPRSQRLTRSTTRTWRPRRSGIPARRRCSSRWRSPAPRLRRPP